MEKFLSAFVWHFSGHYKPSYYAWQVGLGLMSVEHAAAHAGKASKQSGPRTITRLAYREWLSSFMEML
eukprot:6261151-Alexandrium_andersonii.AAC.1